MITFTTPQSLLPAWKQSSSETTSQVVAPVPSAPAPVSVANEPESEAGELPGEGTARPADAPPFDVEPVVDPVAEKAPVTASEATAETADGTTAIPDGDGLVTAIQSIIGTDDLFELEHKLLDPIYKVQRQILSLIEQEDDLDRQLKETRDSLSHSRDAKLALLEALPARLLEIREGKPVGTVTVDSDSRSDASDTTANTLSDTPSPGSTTHWRSILTSTITKGVVGLGDKKAAALINEFPTLGDLEDARVLSSQKKKHFATELPKGIGQQSADELANRIMAAQTAGDTRPASEVVEPRKVNGVAVAKVPTKPKSEAIASHEEHEAWVSEVVASIKETATEPSLKAEAKESWVDGFEAHAEGSKAVDCPRELTEPHQIDWLNGWVYRELYVKAQSPAAGQPGEGETVVCEADEAEAEAYKIHCTFVANTVAWLNRNPHEMKEKSAVNADMWGSGAEAFVDELSPEDCPREVKHDNPELAITEDDQVDWLRGYCCEESQHGDVEAEHPGMPTPLPLAESPTSAPTPAPVTTSADFDPNDL